MSEQIAEEETPKKPKKKTLLATRFMRNQKYLVKDTRKLHYWRGEFFEYTGNCYRAIGTEELCTIVGKWVLGRTRTKTVVGKAKVANVFSDLKNLCLLRGSIEAPSWIAQGKAIAARDLVPFANGLLKVDRLFSTIPSSSGEKADKLYKHSPDLFSLVHIPHKFLPSKEATKWMEFLSYVLPDETARQFLQEWFGYNLVFDVSQEKFVVLVGEGANGKSVVCTVLRAMLGPDNVSHLGLDAFDARRTFPLAATRGCLANIVEEINSVSSISEGLLKQFVSGNPIQVERKFRDPFSLLPTARLTFATNVLPPLADRSTGIWRRLILLPFTQTISEEAQDKRLGNPQFWIGNGEVIGVINWAIEGLVRLRRRGHFIEPEVSVEAKSEYQKDCNPTREFIEARCVAKSGHSTSSRTLYKFYSEALKEGGYHPMPSRTFARELKKVIPGLHQSANAQGFPCGRSRAWIGLSVLMGDSAVLDGTFDTNEFNLSESSNLLS